MTTNSIWGLLAEYNTPEELKEASNKAKEAGYTQIEAYSPFPIEGLSDALGQKKTKIQWLILLGGLVGGIGGFVMQYYANVISYPWNIGGRPLNSWPQFVPVTFELIVLCAASAAVFGMFILNGLPQPYHPVFNVEAFETASRDKFFLCIEAKDEKFDVNQTKSFLESLNANSVYEVEP